MSLTITTKIYISSFTKKYEAVPDHNAQQTVIHRGYIDSTFMNYSRRVFAANKTILFINICINSKMFLSRQMIFLRKNNWLFPLTNGFDWYNDINSRAIWLVVFYRLILMYNEPCCSFTESSLWRRIVNILCSSTTLARINSMFS